MSLQIDGVWKGGLWAPTVWAAGVWREGSTPSLVEEAVKPSGGIPARDWIPFEKIGRNRFLKRRVRKIIEEVALQQAQVLNLDESQRLEHFLAELEAKNIEFEASYLEALNTYREILIENEIRTILVKKDEEEAMLLILIAAHLH